MSITQWARRHHRSILFAFAAFAVAGVFASYRMPVSLFPRVAFPRVVINVDAGDRPAERMVVEVTRPIEDAVRSVLGVRSIRSNSSRGSADISINFGWGTDMVSAMLQVESAVNQARDLLPQGTSFSVRRMDTTVFPVLGYSLTSPTRSLVKLRDLALFRIRSVLSTVDGVARIEILGGKKAEYQIILNRSKAKAFNVSVKDIAAAVASANVLRAVGRLEENYKLYLIVSDTRLNNIDNIRRIIIDSGPSGVVFLGDVALVKKTIAPQWQRVTADGRDAVLFQVYQQPYGNTVQIAKDAKVKIEEIKKHLPADVHIANWYDQSELIVASARSVRDALLIGVGLAVIILLIFLRNIKVTLIAAITVPMVLAATMLFISVLGMSLNIMTLGGMAAAVALIIDDAIVMIEHIIRRLRGGGGHYHERINMAAAEFTRPLFGSSASTIVIFAPLAFLSGVTGAFFKALSLTMATALIISFLIAWLATPLLALHLLRQKDADKKETGALFDFLRKSYEGVMRRLLARPLLLLLFIAPLLGLGVYAYNMTGSGFIPSMDEGGFIIDYRAGAGTSLTETDRLLRQVENILRDTRDVQTYSRRTGLALGGFLTEANEGDFFVRLRPMPRRPLDEVMDDIRLRISREVPGLNIEMAKLMEDIIGDLTAVPQPIEIKLFADNSAVLQSLALRVAQKIRHVHGVVDVLSGVVPAGDALNIRVDPVRAAVEGLTPEAVTKALEGHLTGIVATRIQEGPKMVGVRVWIPRAERGLISTMKNLLIRAPDGHSLPLRRVASLSTENGQPQIMREDLKRMVAVTGRISGRDMGSTLKEVIAVLNKPGLLPPNVYYRLGGLYKQQQIAFRGLLAVFISAVALVFALLLYMYEDFRVAVAMILTTLIAISAVFIGLWVTGTDLNIMAMMGMTMIVGIVTEINIFFYSEFQEIDPDMALEQRLIMAGKNRMRPIAMTTLAAILALTPLALGLGEGSAMLRPLAIAIIAGLSIQLPLVLVGLPALLTLMRKRL